MGSGITSDKDNRFIELLQKVMSYAEDNKIWLDESRIREAVISQLAPTDQKARAIDFIRRVTEPDIPPLPNLDAKKTIAVGFDGPLHAYSEGWKDGRLYDPPREGAKKAIEGLRRMGFSIVVFTQRAYQRVINHQSQRPQVPHIYEWLRRYDLATSGVWQQPWKCPARYYIEKRMMHPYVPGHEWHNLVLWIRAAETTDNATPTIGQ
jgi:hypothetical protein